MKPEPDWLIPRKLTARLELLIVIPDGKYNADFNLYAIQAQLCDLS